MTVLESLLDAGVQLDAEYADGLANHLPMALVALHALGASDARLGAFAQGYRGRLSAAPPPGDWPAGDPWQERFGDPSAYPAYRALFAQWLLHEPAEAVLAQVLPALVRGCGAAAFHGLIRTAYAVEAGHAGELVDGLAYWSCRHLALPAGAAEQGGEEDPQAVLQALWQALAGWRSGERLIVQRMRDAARQPAFARNAARLRIGGDTWERLTRAALLLYAHSGDFTVLHLVTACDALRQLLPFVDDHAPVLRDFWTAYAAGAASVGAPAGQPAPARLADWPSLAAGAIASDDEHVIKLVHSCRELDRLHGWPECRAAAARALAGG